MKNKNVLYTFLILVLFAIASSGCKKEKDEVSVNPSVTLAAKIGEPYEGGILAYVLQPVDPGYDVSTPHGLIASPADISESCQWDSTFTYTGATGRELGTGNMNTNAIVAAVGSGNYAARLCYDLVLNGYNDWFLPSQIELGKLSGNKEKIGGFISGRYWASNENTNFQAWSEGFGADGSVYYSPKNMLFCVRAVRAF